MPIQKAEEIHTIGLQAFSAYCHESGEIMPTGRLFIQVSEHKDLLNNAFEFWVDAVQPDNLQRKLRIETCKKYISKDLSWSGLCAED